MLASAAMVAKLVAIEGIEVKEMIFTLALDWETQATASKSQAVCIPT